MKRTSFLLRMLVIASIFLSAIIGLSVGYPRQWHFHKAAVMIFNAGICLWLYITYRRCIRKKNSRLGGILEERAKASDIEAVTMTFVPLALGFIIAFLPQPWSAGESVVIITASALYACRVLYLVAGRDFLRYLKNFRNKNKKVRAL